MAHQIYGPDIIKPLQLDSSTELSLPASRLTIGGLQYDTLELNLDISIDGVGGLPGGAGADTLYYVYAVLDTGSPALVASSSNEKPVGFNSYKKVGAFITGHDNLILLSAKYGDSLKFDVEEIFLASNFSSTGSLPSFSFSNLVIGEKYTIIFTPNLQVTEGATGITVLNGVTTLCQRTNFQNGGVSDWDSSSVIRDFTASDANVTFSVTGTGTRNIIGTGTPDNTYAQLKRVPVSPDWNHY